MQLQQVYRHPDVLLKGGVALHKLIYVLYTAAVPYEADILQGWRSWGLQQQSVDGRGSMQTYK